MGNRSRLLSLAEQFVVFSVLQLLFGRFVNVAGVVPNVLLVWILYLGWSGFGTSSMAIAFLCGVLYDLMMRGNLGWSSLLLITIAYLNGFLPRSTFRSRMGSVALFSLVYFVCLSYDPASGFLRARWTVVKYSVLFATCNCLLAVAAEAYRARFPWKENEFSAT